MGLEQCDWRRGSHRTWSSALTPCRTVQAGRASEDPGSSLAGWLCSLEPLRRSAHRFSGLSNGDVGRIM